MDPHQSPLLAGFPVIITMPVQWGDQDAFGHVNNTVYLRWFESARITYGERIGLSALMATHKIGPILAAIRCNYLRQLNYPDTVRIGARISRIGRSSMVMEHQVESETTGMIVAEGDSTIVVFNYVTNRSTPVTEELRAAVNQLEGKTL